MAAKGCPGFVVEFNYSIIGDDPMSLTSLLHGVPNCTAVGAAAAAASDAAAKCSSNSRRTTAPEN